MQRAMLAFVQPVAAAGTMHRSQVDDRGGLLGGMAVNTVVQHAEVAIQLAKRIGRIGVERDFQVIGLPDVPDIGGVPDRYRRVANALLRHQPRAGTVKFVQHAARIGEIQAGQRTREGDRHLMLDRRGQQTRGGQYARMAWDQHVCDAEFGGERGRMDRAGAAEGDQREAAWIEAAADRDQADALDHLRVHHAMDTERRVLHRQSEWSRDAPLDGSARQRRIERHGTAGEIGGIEPAKHDRCVGDGGFLAATPVAGGAWLGARRMRADTQPAGAIEPGDGAAAGADRIHIDHRHAHRIPGDVALRADHRFAAFHQRDVAGGAADIDGDEVAAPR